MSGLMSSRQPHMPAAAPMRSTTCMHGCVSVRWVAAGRQKQLLRWVAGEVVHGQIRTGQ